MSSWSTRVCDDWLKNGTPYHDSDTFVEPQNTVQHENFADSNFCELILRIDLDSLKLVPVQKKNAK